MSHQIFDTFTEAQEFQSVNGGVIKLGQHYGLGIYDYAVVPEKNADEFLGYDEYLKMLDFLYDEKQPTPTYDFASKIVAARFRSRFVEIKKTGALAPTLGEKSC